LYAAEGGRQLVIEGSLTLFDFEVTSADVGILVII